MSDTTSVDDQGPTQQELAGLFSQFRGTEPGQGGAEPTSEPAQPVSEPAPEPLAEPEAAPAEPEPAGETEAQEFEAEHVETEAEPTEPTAPFVPPPAGMTTAEIAEFEQLSPEMQRFVALREANRNTDYQAKTTELAGLRRETEAKRNQYIERLNSQIGALEQQAAKRPTPPDPALRLTDYEAYEEQRDAYMLAIHQKAENDAELAEAKQKRSEELQRIQQDFLTEQQALLPSMIPESTDPTKFAQIQKDVAEYGLQQGYTAEQLQGFRAVDLKMLYQSLKWERATKAASGTGTTAKPKAPKAQRPGTASPTKTAGQKQYGQARKAFDANPDRNSLAGLFAAQRAERSA